MKEGKEPIRKTVFTPLAPKPVGPYNHAVMFNGLLYVSGVIGLDPSTNKMVEGIQLQTRQVLNSMGHILRQGGSCFENILKITIMLEDITEFAQVNEIYKEYFLQRAPARSTYQVGKLPLNARIEIDCIAAVGPISHSCDCGSI